MMKFLPDIQHDLITDLLIGFRMRQDEANKWFYWTERLKLKNIHTGSMKALINKGYATIGEHGIVSITELAHQYRQFIIDNPRTNQPK